jgi:hypothetical protein
MHLDVSLSKRGWRRPNTILSGKFDTAYSFEGLNVVGRTGSSAGKEVRRAVAFHQDFDKFGG